jgi:hypothetical protein
MYLPEIPLPSPVRRNCKVRRSEGDRHQSLHTLQLIQGSRLYETERFLYEMADMEQRMQGCEYQVKRRIYVPKKNEVTQKWRKLRNEKLLKLHASTGIRMTITWNKEV